MKLRRILYRLIGAIVSVLGLGLIFKFYYSSVLISVGTVILIFGVAIWMMATPEDYNNSTDIVKMVSFGDTVRKSRISMKPSKMYPLLWAAAIWDIFVL